MVTVLVAAEYHVRGEGKRSESRYCIRAIWIKNNGKTILFNGKTGMTIPGDIGCPLIREQKDLLKHLDAILIPVGGYYTIDAVQAKALADDLAPRVVIPMHYRSDHFGYPVIGRLEEFTGLCRNVVEYDSNTLLLTAETRPQTAVLKL